MAGVLDDVKILDFTQEIQGPWGTALLADMGAEVFKIERRETGEFARSAGTGRQGGATPAVDLKGINPYILVFNRGKKSITLDLKHPQAKEIIYKLAARCDVVVNNWRPGVLDSLGFGYQDLVKIRKNIIYAHATTFGSIGPWAQLGGRDTLGQAIGGLMSVTGFEGSPPIPAGSLVADQTSGMILALGILAALRHRDRTGEGQVVNISLYGTILAMQAWEITQRSLAKVPIRRAGRNHCFSLRGVWGAFKTADGYICLAGCFDQQWPAFCRILGIQKYEHDQRFATAVLRGQNEAELHELLDKTLSRKITKEWLEALQKEEFLCAEVQNYDQILENEQALVNGYIATLDHPVLGKVKLVGNPVGLSKTPPKIQGPEPQIGQHTEETLLWLGYTWKDIERLRDNQAI